MGVMDKIIADSIPVWDECLNTPFIQELGKGTLDEDKMTKYIVEDTTYLTEYAKCFAYQIAKCRTLDEMRYFYSILAFVNEKETGVRRAYLINKGINEVWAETRTPDKENKEYIDHMMHYCKNGTLLEGLISLLPCMLSYEYIFERLLKMYPNMLSNKYKHILETYIHSPNEMHEGDIWVKYAEKLISEYNEKDIDKLSDIFKKASVCELEFWKMSYNNKLILEK